MPCYRPLSAYHTYNADGSRSIAFGNESKTGTDGTYVDLPCGQCIGCRLERSRRWAVRIMHESQLHAANSFLTLTYDQKNLPVNSSLNVQDFQLFMKRLRRGTNNPLRFFHCGEYGETSARPHYHACIFGTDFIEDRIPFTKTAAGHNLHTSEKLTKTWGLGHAIIGDLTFESAAYVARYCLKKITGPKASEHYGQYSAWPPFRRQNGELNLDPGIGTHHLRAPEYVTMSRRPGIGAAWFDKHHREAYPSDSVVMRGREMLPPPYYDKLLERSDPALFESIKRERASAAKLLGDHPDSASARLLTREFVTNETVKNTLRRSV